METKVTLLVGETASIQDYVFRSNRLRENLGGSYLVYKATTLLVHNVLNQMRAADELKGEAKAFFKGGGNIVYRFTHKEDAARFITRIKLKGRAETPGLRLMFHTQDFYLNDPERPYWKQVESAFKELNKKSNQRTAPHTPLGISITRLCRTTGLAATDFSAAGTDSRDRSAEASPEVIARHKAVRAARDRLYGQFENSLGDLYCFPETLEDLGQTEGSDNHVAVVHADGNRIGAIRRKVGKGLTEDAYIDAIDSFSTTLRDASSQAMNDLVNTLINQIKQGRIREDGMGNGIVLYNGTGQNREKLMLPFLPLVFGGDDVTFVADGRLGVWLAAVYLRCYEKRVNEAVRIPGHTGSITASAGVAIVRTHYPFARAYKLANELCDNAKTYYASHEGSWIDWHMAQTGLMGTLSMIRQREYRADSYLDKSIDSLTLRPLVLDQSTGDIPEVELAFRNWSVLAKGRKALKRWPRNKVHRLKDALRVGPEGVQRFSEQTGLILPEVLPENLSKEERTTGFIRQRSYYSDALDTLGMFLPEDLENV